MKSYSEQLSTATYPFETFKEKVEEFVEQFDHVLHPEKEINRACMTLGVFSQTLKHDKQLINDLKLLKKKSELSE